MEERISLCLDRYMDYMGHALGRSDHTVLNYAVDLAQFAEFLLAQGVDAPEAVETGHIRRFLREMMGFGYARSTVARKLSAVKSWLAYLVQSGEVPRNVAVAVRAPSLPQRLPRALAPAEVTRLIEEGSAGRYALRDRAVLEVLYGCGLRVAELVSIDWGEVDLIERWIRISGKGKKERQVPVGSYARQALLAWEGETGSRGPLFPGTRGNARLTVRTVHRIVERAGKRAGIAGVSPHVLRHSYATHMLEGGAGLRVLQELMGHESLVTTQRYLRITTDQMKASYMSAHPRSGG
ncbi:MAG: tyrosine recombinase XerC [Synergistales bacterium]|nr:tyrosine recombinase XerC [Synergistales bacterium]